MDIYTCGRAVAPQAGEIKERRAMTNSASDWVREIGLTG